MKSRSRDGLAVKGPLNQITFKRKSGFLVNFDGDVIFLDQSQIIAT